MMPYIALCSVHLRCADLRTMQSPGAHGCHNGSAILDFGSKSIDEDLFRELGSFVSQPIWHLADVISKGAHIVFMLTLPVLVERRTRL
jgi:hypothetical protein